MRTHPVGAGGRYRPIAREAASLARQGLSLRDEGLLTDEEFSAQKAGLLTD